MTATMREYALTKTVSLMDDVVFALHAAAKLPDEEAVHKMRVSIRRFQQALRLFRQYFEEKGIEKIKAELRSVMDVAGELRNRDIAMALVTEAGVDPQALFNQRMQFKHKLTEVLRPYAKPDLSLRWRGLLGLESAA